MRIWAAAVRRRHLAASVFLTLFAGISGGLVMTTFEVSGRTSTALDRFIDQPTFVTHLLVGCPVGLEVEDIQNPATDCGGESNVRDVAKAALDSPVVESAVPIATVIAGLKAESSDGWTPTIQYAAMASLDGIPGAPVVVSGRLPRVDASDEVAINEVLAARLGVTAGDTIISAAYSPDELGPAMSGEDQAPVGESVDMRVTAIVRIVDDVAPAPEPALFTTFGWWDRYGGDDVASYGKGVALRLRGSMDVASIEESLRQVLPGRLLDVSDFAESTQTTRGVIELQAAASWAVAVVSLLAAMGFVGQALARESVRDLDDRRALGALGVTRFGQVFGVVLRMLPSGVGAGLVASLVAVLASPVGPIGLARRLEIAPGFDFDAVVVVVGGLAVGVFTLAVPALRAWTVLARRRRRAVRPFINLSTTPWVSARAGLSFLRRGDQSTGGGAAVGSALAVAVVIFAVGIGGSYDALLANPERFGQSWDVVLGDFSSDDEIDGALSAIEGVDGVGGWGLARSTMASVGLEEVFVFAFVDPDGVVGPTIVTGRAPLGGAEVALGQEVLDALDLSVGDEVTFAGAIDEAEIGPLEIVGVPVANDGVNPAQSMGRGALVSNELFDRFDRLTKGQSYLVAAADGMDPARLQERLGEAFEGPVNPARSPDDVTNLARVEVAPLILALLVLVFGVSAMVNGLVTLVGKRRHEVATLRSLGFTRLQVLGSTLTVGMALAASAVVVGVPLGLLVTRAGWSVVESRLGIPSASVVPLGWLVVVSVSTVVTALLLAAFPGVRATRVKASEALRVE